MRGADCFSIRMALSSFIDMDIVIESLTCLFECFLFECEFSFGGRETESVE